MDKEVCIDNFENNDSYDCYLPKSLVGCDLVVYECGYEKCSPRHFWGPDKKKFFTIHYVVSGKGTLTIDGNPFDASTGQLFYFSPENTIYYVSDDTEPWEYLWIGFNGFRAKNIMSMTKLSESSPVHNVLNKEEIQHILMDIVKFSKNDFTPNLLATGNLYLFLAWLIQNFPNEKVGISRAAGDGIFNNIIRYIQEKFTTKLTVKDLCATFNYERTNIYKLFIKHAGMSPTKYIECLKINYACELIAANKYTLKEVAEMSGFDSYAWFANVFTQITGVTLNEFVSAPKMTKPSEDMIKIQQILKKYMNYMSNNALV